MQITDEEMEIIEAENVLHRLYILTLSGSIKLKPEETLEIARIYLRVKKDSEVDNAV